MPRSLASQASRRDARPASERWPRVGATIENGKIVVRLLEDSEPPHPAFKRAVRIAEPCERHRTLPEAIQHVAAVLVSSLREKAGNTMEVVNGLV